MDTIFAQFQDYPDMLTPPQLMKMLSMSKTSTYRLLSENVIPSIKLGRVYRIPKVYVIQYIKEHISGVTAPAVTAPPEAPSMAELANPIASESVLTAQMSGTAM